MNRSTAALLFIIINAFTLSAQMSEGGLPYSVSLLKLKGTASLPGIKLKDFDKSALLKEDRLHPIPFRYAIFEDVNSDIRSSGKRDSVPFAKGIIWRMKFESDSAYSIQLILSKFNIPPGAKLYLYNENLTQVAGAFTSNNMQSDSSLAIADIIGNKAVIEYFEPFDVAFHGRVIIGSISKAYKNIYQVKSGDAYININCPEGKDLQLPKHAVCKISFKSGVSSYLCTGSLINNVRQNGKPYFLTASHCINDSAEASTLVAYFNYENEDCNGVTLTPTTLSGAKLLSTAPSSDYSLLLLNNSPGNNYQPYYAGWDANDVVATHVSGIHHPEGLTKKLSIDNDTTVSNPIVIQWDVNSISPVASHWQVNFDEGLTAGGSSGSPLLNIKKQVIGQLHGGDNTYDLYGKFSYSWTHTSGKYPSLKSFLDPDNTGKMTLDGYSSPNTPPDAFIAIPVSKVCTLAPVMLTDYSAFAPYTRTWTISPSAFSFTGGTNSSSANPQIEFLQPGSYSVNLKISKSSGTDSMRIDNAFQAGTTLDVGISSSPPGESCLCNLDHFLAIATGAASYEWSVQPGSMNKIFLNQVNGDTVKVSPFPGFYSDSSLTVDIQVKGTHGTCSDTAKLSYLLINQVNDSIRKAVTLQYGNSPTYSNKCATIESLEPVPPHTSCTTQDSWCDEYGTGLNIVEHSVWFKFIAGNTGYVSISSSGFDNEIALYDANSYSDILNGNYTILAANDDRSSSDFNPIIRLAQVTPGKTYWLQVDGSGGGSVGNFNLQLIAVTVTGVTAEKESLLVVYPQPARDYVFIKGLPDDHPVNLTVYNSKGTLICKETAHPVSGSIQVNVNSWYKGIYVVKIESGSNLLTTRVIKY